MTHDDLVALFAPTVAALVLALATLAAGEVSGARKALVAWMRARGMAAEAAAVESSSSVLEAALQVRAHVLAGKIQDRQLDFTNKAALLVAVMDEVRLVELALPRMVAIALPVAGTMVASLASKVAALQSKPVLITPPPGDTASRLKQSAQEVLDAQAILQSLGMPALLAVTAAAEAPTPPTASAPAALPPATAPDAPAAPAAPAFVPPTKPALEAVPAKGPIPTNILIPAVMNTLATGA